MSDLENKLKAFGQAVFSVCTDVWVKIRVRKNGWISIISAEEIERDFFYAPEFLGKELCFTRTECGASVAKLKELQEQVAKYEELKKVCKKMFDEGKLRLWGNSNSLLLECVLADVPEEKNNQRLLFEKFKELTK